MTAALLFLALPLAQQAPTIDIVGQLRAEAAALRPIVETELARMWLDQTAKLPDPGTRTVYRVGNDRFLTQSEYDAEKPAEAKKTNYPPQFYYLTRYGSPLAYVRSIDLAAKHGLTELKGKSLLDFGYGGIGHLRLSAEMGARAVGLEVDPLLPALYSAPGDAGQIGAGSVKLVHGFWPGGEGVADQAGGGFDLFLSKNTLKRGYIHPERPVDPRRLVHLGVSDEEYLNAVADALNPGGLMVVYNLAPPQNPADKEFIPAADGRFPFARELAEKVGFEVLAFDVDDSAFARKMGALLSWGNPEDLEKTIFATYTVLRKKN